jgi:ABC-type branched-subunit amino acid transport system substrate-binding protein
MKVAIQTPHYDNLRNATKYFVEKGRKAICTLVQDNEFGREVASGVEAQLKEMNLPLVAQATHRADDKDFSAQLSRLRASGCDAIAIGTVIADTIGIMSTAKRMGWSPDFFGSSSVFSPENVALARGATEGLYAMTQITMPYENDGTPFARNWYARYVKRFGDVPGFQAASTYVAADLFLVALERAGRNLTVEALVTALEGIKDYRDPFEAGPPISFSPTVRLGTNRGFLAHVQNGRWVKVTGDLSY